MRLIAGCLVIGAAASLSTSSGVCAQQVAQAGDSSGAVVGALVGIGDTQAVPYGTVLLLETGQARFTDEDGRFRLTRLVPGTYKLRARQIGYAPIDTTIRVDPGPAITNVTISMRRLPPLLGLVKVEGHRSKDCGAPGVPDSTINPTLAAIFAQVRENVDRYRVLWDEYPFRYTREESMLLLEDLGRDSTIRIETGSYESKGQRRYKVGVVVADEVDSAAHVRRVMYLPTFRDLADSTFLDVHCFTFGGSEQLDPKSTDRVLRVDFQPIREITTPDVEGSIYLDAERLVIRRSVFRLTKPQSVGLISFTTTATYRELMQNVPVLDESRTVQPVPRTAAREIAATGTRSFVIQDRFSNYTFENAAPGEQPAMGGEALTQGSAPGSAAGHGVGTVEGRVIREDGVLVAGAAVGLLASHDSTATSDSGRFVIRDVHSGAHMLWVHGVGIKPTRVAVTVPAGQSRSVTISVVRTVPVLQKIVTKARFPAGYVNVGLDKRIEAGVGNIITFDQIQKMNAVKVSDLLHGVRGIHLRVYFDPDARIMSSQGGCVAFMLDGVPQKVFTSHDVDNLVSPDQIAVIEIYSPAEAPVGWGGATPGSTEETIKGESTPSGVVLNVTPGVGATAVGTAQPVAVPVPAALPEPCAVMAIWTIAHLNVTRGDTAAAPDSGFRATASRATETSGTAVFPPGAVPACEPPTPSDAATLDVYAELRDELPAEVHDSAWRSYSAAVLRAIRQTFAFPSELELPVFGYATSARPTARNLQPRGLVVSPSLSTVISFTVSPTGELLESHVAASSLSGDADTSVLAAVQSAAVGNLIPAMPATGLALRIQSARFNLMVTTTAPDAADLAVLLDQIDVPVWPLGRAATLVPGKYPDLKSLRSSPDAKPDSAMFELVVDEHGKAIMPTVRAISQTAAGAADSSYRAFVTQVAGLLPKFQFEPALVGGCPVRQTMLQPLTD